MSRTGYWLRTIPAFIFLGWSFYAMTHYPSTRAEFVFLIAILGVASVIVWVFP